MTSRHAISDPLSGMLPGTTQEDMTGNDLIIVGGHPVIVGPLLAHMMLACQALQDDLLRLAHQATDMRRRYLLDCPVRLDDGTSYTASNGRIDLDLEMAFGYPLLTVSYITKNLTATYNNAAGEADETFTLTVADETAAVAWIEREDLEERGPYTLTLPFNTQLGASLTVPAYDLDTHSGRGAEWTISGTTWDGLPGSGHARTARMGDLKQAA